VRRIEQNGYTLLVEALVAFSLFLVAALGFYSMLAGVQRAELKARRTVAATAYAKELLEIHRAYNYPDLPLGKTSGSRSVQAVRRGTTSTMTMNHLVTVRDGPMTGTKSILVEVSWHSGSVSLEGYVGQ